MIRLKELREEAGMLQKEISSELSIERSLYGKYENGRSEPPYDVLIRIADHFNVTIDYLLGRTDEPQPYLPLQPVALPAAPALTAEEQELVERFRELNPEGQTAALGALRLYAAMPEYKKPPVSRQIQEIG